MLNVSEVDIILVLEGSTVRYCTVRTSSYSQARGVKAQLSRGDRTTRWNGYVMNSARHPSLELRLFSRESPTSFCDDGAESGFDGFSGLWSCEKASEHPHCAAVLGSHYCSRRLDYRSIVPPSLRTAEDPRARGPDGENGGIMPASSNDLPGKVEGWAAIPQHLSLRDTADMLFLRRCLY
jgi:hypothetical protein